MFIECVMFRPIFLVENLLLFNDKILSLYCQIYKFLYWTLKIFAIKNVKFKNDICCTHFFYILVNSSAISMRNLNLKTPHSGEFVETKTGKNYTASKRRLNLFKMTTAMRKWDAFKVRKYKFYFRAFENNVCIRRKGSKI